MVDKVRLAFVGDISLSFWRNRFDDTIASFPEWNHLAEAIGPHDLLIGNLECCLVDRSFSDWAKQQDMAVPVEKASVFAKAGFSALSMANNHMLDCGSAAVCVTRERLQRLGIEVFGAGRDMGEAEDACIMKRAGKKIAFLSACDYVPYYATEARTGIAPIARHRLGQRVRAATREAELVVVILHADLEFSTVPARWRQRLSRWLIDQGAHLVIQHHPHVLQGIEQYGGGLIAYSLGNFVFPLKGNSYQENRAGVYDSMIFIVDVVFSEDGPILSYRIEPARIAEDHFPRRLGSDHRDLAIDRIDALSDLLLDSNTHRRLWFNRCQRELRSRIWSVSHALAGRRWRDAAEGCWCLVARTEDRRWLVGLCSAGRL